MLEVVRNAKRIASFAKEFAKILKADSRETEKRVQFPGYGSVGVQILRVAKAGDFWSCHKVNSKALMFWFGTNINQKEPITPSIEINFPRKAFDRLRKGRFLLANDQAVFVAHRGLLGGGRASVPMKEFDQHIRRFNREEVYLDVRRDKRETVYVVGALNSSDFLPSLTRYVEEAERIREIKRAER
jgi:hypothetical protein